MRRTPIHDDLSSSPPAPVQQQAVKLALCLFRRRYPPCHPDRFEWQRDCEGEAWLAVLQHASTYCLPDPPPADPERHQLFWLMNCAYNALRRFWHQERRYYGSIEPIIQVDEEGEEIEHEFADEVAHAMVLDVLDRVFCAQVLERLWPCLDEKDWAILHGLAEGKRQAELAQVLKIKQPAISKRLRRIKRLAQAILQEFGYRGL